MQRSGVRSPSPPPAFASQRSEEAKAAAAKRVSAKPGYDPYPYLLSYGSARPTAIMRFFYVYILQSETALDRFYTGFTEELDARLRAHNAGQCSHSSKHRPWRIKTAVAFTDRERALDFERYLKSPSGRAFAKKRL